MNNAGTYFTAIPIPKFPLHWLKSIDKPQGLDQHSEYTQRHLLREMVEGIIKIINIVQIVGRTQIKNFL
jgi:hypothetical protein